MMNDRIKLLAEQAGKHFPKTEMSGEFWVFDEEKFAKLIVAECMKLNSKELSITAIERLLPLYAEHFGVTE